MGQTQAQRALVIMTNGDTYYLSEEAVRRLEQRVSEGARLFITKDVRSGSTLSLSVAHVSAIVVGS